MFTVDAGDLKRTVTRWVLQSDQTRYIVRYHMTVNTSVLKSCIVEVNIYFYCISGVDAGDLKRDIRLLYEICLAVDVGHDGTCRRSAHIPKHLRRDCDLCAQVCVKCDFSECDGNKLLASVKHKEELASHVFAGV